MTLLLLIILFILIIFNATERSSTRLHAPPGGKTSISFGDYQEAPAPVNRNRMNNIPAPVATENIAPRRNYGGNKSSIQFGDDSSSFEKPTVNNVAVNKLSNQSQKFEAPAPVVRQGRGCTPGGNSTIFFG